MPSVFMAYSAFFTIDIVRSEGFRTSGGLFAGTYSAVALSAAAEMEIVFCSSACGAGKVTMSCRGVERLRTVSNVVVAASLQLKGVWCVASQKSLRTVATIEQWS